MKDMGMKAVVKKRVFDIFRSSAKVSCEFGTQFLVGRGRA